MKRNTNLVLPVSIIFLFFLTTSCGTINPYYGKSYRNWESLSPPDTAKLAHTVFLIGDAGTLDNNPVLQLMNRQMQQADSITTKGDTTAASQNAVVFLGDNIYYYGLPEEDAIDREEKEKIINNQMDALHDFRGRKIFIPGNHDWRESSPGGLETLNRQEEYIENYGDSTIEMLPNLGCPGPYEIHLTDDMLLIIVDSEWWLTPHEKPVGPENGCFVDDRFDFIVQLEDIVQRNTDKNILIVQHHPLFSNGNHGTRFSLKDNIFPLTLVRDNLYIPLPVIGSLYPLLRKYGLAREDIPNPVYQELIEEELSVIEDKPNIVFAAGHDHNLQLRDYKEISHIISGSGGKTNFATRGSDASYVQQIMGFCRLDYYDNGEVWVEFWTASEDHPEGRITFKYPLYAYTPPEKKKLVEQESVDYTDSTKVIAAGEDYSAGKFKQFWLGKHYRKEWTTAVTVPYLDMKTEAGGLIPIQKGGGNQTVSLRLMNKDSVQYNLRSIDKNPQGAIPEPLFNTFAEDLVQDQISTAHPYGALAIPKMAEALHLFHTTPKLFYTPYTNLLGPYLNDFGGRLAMLEIRPDEDLSEFKRFGYSKNVVSTKTMLRHLEEDNDNEVDNKMYLKNRLFDMLINDWDRHADQWRWSEFEKEGKGSLFKPVARDRDQVFTKYDGIIPYIISRKWGIRNLKNFDFTINDVVGLNLAAKDLDRRLLTNLSKEEWLAIADTIKQQLTDEAIRKAINDMPAEVVNLSGSEIIDKLKSRRDQIINWTLAYYLVLAKEVDVVGTDKHEFFLIERLNDRDTRVSIYKMKKEGDVKQKLYERTFHADETEEIRLYAKKDSDSILIKGDADRGIKLRIIGGSGDDVIIDHSTGGKVLVYDQSTEDNEIVKGSNTRLRLSKKESVNEYNPEGFQYDYLGPRLFFEYNKDDGIYLGGGIYIEKHGFRKSPKTTHLLVANYAFNIDAYNIKYEGNFYSVLAPNWDLSLKAHSFGPKYVLNYFGRGNGSENVTEDIGFYRIHMNSLQFHPSVNHRFSDFFKVGFGPAYEFFELKENKNTIVDNPDFMDYDDLEQSSYFWGANLFANISLQDYAIDPQRGVKWKNEVNYYQEFNSGSTAFTNLSTDVALYVTPNLPVSITAAIRFGASTNIGDYEFYQSEFLGGNSNLRGYRNFRFAGRSAMFNNTELRIRLFNINNYVFTGSYGLIGFIDSGRVWSDVDEPNVWHRSFGPGAWINFYKLFLVSGTVGFSDEGTFLNLHLGHFF